MCMSVLPVGLYTTYMPDALGDQNRSCWTHKPSCWVLGTEPTSSARAGGIHHGAYVDISLHVCITCLLLPPCRT